MAASCGNLLPLAALLALGMLSGACSRAPEGLIVGDCEIPWETLDEADAELRVAFEIEGPDTRRRHLLEFGMGPAALLHHAHPEASAAARARAEAGAARLAAAADKRAEILALLREAGLPDDEAIHLQPYPAALGARVAAKVASLEPGAWAGPLRTLEGWTLILLEDRVPGPRNRANVLVYRMDYLVGDAEDRRRAAEEWATLPLAGNPELLDALPLEFTRGRVRDQP